MFIRKRDGSVVDFDFSKIENAILAAKNDNIDLDILKSSIMKKINASESEVLGVEDISDITEESLMDKKYFKTARAFIIYRDHRTKKRIDELQEEVAHGKIKVRKSSGKIETFKLSKVRKTLELKSPQKEVDLNMIENELVKGLHDNIASSDILKLLTMSTLSFSDRSKAYDELAARLFLQKIYKEVFNHSATEKTFESLYHQAFEENMLHCIDSGVFKKELARFDLKKLSTALIPSRDMLFEYMGISTAYDKYLYKENKRPLETPQAFWMRVAMGLAWNEPDQTTLNEKAIEHYNVLSTFDGVHSTPTLFYSGLSVSQLASCGGYTIDDSIESIMSNNKKHAELSKWSYGLGFSASKVRAVGSRVKSTNITSGGIIPFIKILNDTTACINRSGRKRGAAVVYIEPWHYEIESFLDLRKNTGDDRLRAHDLNTALWIPDLFMQRVEQDGEWYLFDPAETKNLTDLYGKEFSAAYRGYERFAEEGKLRIFKKVQAKDLWKKVLSSLFTTGFPWITFKDAMNVRNNASHRGVIYSSNLCLAPETEVEIKVDSIEKRVTIREVDILFKSGKQIEVLSRNIKNNTTEYKSVYNSALMNNSSKVIKIIDSDSGRNIVCTPDHKVWTENRGYVMAKDLKFNDILKILNKIDFIEMKNKLIIEEIEEEIPVYDISVEDNHNFFANDILVHNCTEIAQNTIPDVEMFNCFLASVNLANIYDANKSDSINWDKLSHISRVLTKRLDNAQGDLSGTLKLRYYSPTEKFMEFSPFDKIFVGDKYVYAFEFQEGMRIHFNGSSYLAEIVKKPIYIENNFYPTSEIFRGAMLNRSSGLGVMGWQDLLFKLSIPFDSEEATALLDKIMEHIAYCAYEASAELAEERGACPVFAGSLPSRGILPIDTLKLLDDQRGSVVNVNRTTSLDWDALRQKIAKFGLRNMWLLSPAPTATISTVVGTYPSIEAQFSNVYVKENMQGTFTVVNSYLEFKLKELGLWSDSIVGKIKKANGRLDDIEEIPAEVKLLFRDAFQVDPIRYVEQGAVMSKWIDQSHSRNMFVEEPTGRLLNNIYMESWRRGLKTTYYLRSKGATGAEKSTS